MIYSIIASLLSYSYYYCCGGCRLGSVMDDDDVEGIVVDVVDYCVALHRCYVVCVSFFILVISSAVCSISILIPFIPYYSCCCSCIFWRMRMMLCCGEDTDDEKRRSTDLVTAVEDDDDDDTRLLLCIADTVDEI